MPPFIQQREKFSEIQKQTIDELEFFRGLRSIYKGMQYLTHGLGMMGVIKDPVEQYDEGEKTQNIRENIYYQRFGYFGEVMFPRLKTYEEYSEKFDQELAQLENPDDPKLVLEGAKNLILEGNAYLKNLKETPAQQRSNFYKNEILEEIQKIAITNSLAIAQVQMMKAKDPDTKLRPEIEVTNKYLPTLKIKEAAPRKD